MTIESRYVISSVRPPDHNLKPAVTFDLGKIQQDLDQSSLCGAVQ